MAVKYDRVLLAKTEVTKGTDAVPVVGSDAIRCRTFDVSVTPDVIDNVAVKQTMGMLPHLIGKEIMQLDVEIAVKGSGAAGTAPEFGPLLKACGLAETVTPATSVAYDPSSDIANHDSVTVYAYKDGLLWKFLGAVGTGPITVTMNEIITISFTLQAPYLAPTAVADPAGAVYQASQPLVGNSSDVVNDGSVIKVGTFSLDMANDVQEHYVTGDHQFVVADRAPVLTFTKDSVATAAEWAALSGGTNAALSGTFGATAGNICAITAPVGRRETIAYGERAERDLLDVGYRLYESTGDDQFQILFT